MQPRELVERWVKAFKRAESPVVGRDAIRAMFAIGFASAKMVCIVEQIFEV